jgi:hypothetical protein
MKVFALLRVVRRNGVAAFEAQETVGRRHSYLSASIGSRAAAFRAG